MNTNTGSIQRDRSLTGLPNDISIDFPAKNMQTLGSGAGAGNVNHTMNSKYRMDFQVLQDLQSKLQENTAENAMNVSQRQQIFEDIIIQRIKVIQNYVRKQVQKMKGDDQGRLSGGTNNMNAHATQPSLVSIHNDGIALDLKIKDIVQWKIEEFMQKQKYKDDRMLQMEVAINRMDKSYQDGLTAVSEASQQEFEYLKANQIQISERMHAHEQNVDLLTE